jgi:hypothetical protein
MAKLKCWKKISDTKYVNKKRKGTLYIFDGRKVNIEIDTVKIGRTSFPQTHIHEEFKTNKEADKFASKYMKENC